MRYKFSKTIVIALGGSVVHPDDIDTAFLKRFKNFLIPFTRRGVRFVIVVGGGRLARRFQEATHEISQTSRADKDLLGIHATWMNAHLVRIAFGKLAEPTIMNRRGYLKKLKHPITISGGWPPGGSSTDNAAIKLAHDFGANEAIIAGKPAYVYSRDPVKFPKAKKFNALTWREYRKLIPRKWMPGMGAPVDPVAAAFGEKEDIKAIIIDGRNLGNFAALLNGKEFRGTIVG